MEFKCGCSFRTRALGDGCQKCNTSEVIDKLYSPEELAEELEDQAFFTADQASYIASDVYQPLLSIITTLNEKVDELAKAISDTGAARHE